MKKLISLLFCVIFFVSCSEDVDVSGTTGTITGSVADKTTGEPIPVASIKLSPTGKTTITGSDGAFEFNDIEAGEYTISATKEGYNSGKNSVVVAAGSNSECHILMERIPAVVTADRDVLDFGSNYSTNTLSFNIVNNNYETLEWEIINNCGWITSVSPASGKLAHGKTGTIVVKIDRDILSDGNNVAVLVLSTAGNGSVEVTVKADGQAIKLATLNTLEVTNISATKATFNGEIVFGGYPEYTERGFVYNELPMPTVEQTLLRLTSPISADNNYSYNTVGLSLGKTYYVRAYAVNKMGIAYSSNQVMFTTTATAGKVEMVGVDDINLSTHTAVAHANVTDIGDPGYSERGFVYSNTNTTPTIHNDKVVVSGTDLGTFDAKLTELARETKYYVRAYVKNEAGVAYSENVTEFDTVESLATVETLDATDIDEATYSAVLHGTISFEGAPAYFERGFVYSTEYEAPTIDDNKVVVSGLGLGEFEARVSGFSAEDKTYVRAYVKNSKGVAYGKTVTVFEPDFVKLPTAGIAVQKTDASSYQQVIKDAERLCENSTLGGFSDWRLPTINELSTIYAYKNDIGNFVNYYYWSSSYKSEYNNKQWNYYRYYLSMTNGGTGTYNEKYNYTCYVRCVRTLAD